MGNIFREQRRSSIVMAALTLLLGLLLVLAPNRSIRLLCTVLGAALLVTGLIYLFTWLAKRRDGFPRLVPDPGADSGGPGAVAAHQPRVGDRPHPVQRGGGAHLPRGH